MNEKINKTKRNKMKIKIIAWNCQTLNDDIRERNKKIKFIGNWVKDIGPDIIFIIDAGKNHSKLLLPNYTLRNNGRDILGISQWIKEEVDLEFGNFIMKDIGMIFTYIRPNEKDTQKRDWIKEKIKQKYKIVGDMNLKTNKDIYDLLTVEGGVDGEDTLQTVITKDLEPNQNIIQISAPSDHKMVVFEVEKIVRNTAKMRLKNLQPEETEEVINGILKEGKWNQEIKIKQIKNRPSMTEEEYKKGNLIRAFINAKLDVPYKYYQFLWKGDKKEPFLGTSIPEKVEEDLRRHYNHNDEKIYQEIPKVRRKDKEGLYPIRQSYSQAQTYEAMKLETIDKALVSQWEGLNNIEKEKAIDNLIEVFNRNNTRIVFKAFFLAKTKELESVNDIRIIVVPPMFLKIWESLIYDKVVQGIGRIIDNEGLYQHGGKPGSSTYYACFELKKKTLELKSKAIVFIDISKGFDNVKFDELEIMIEEIEDETVKSVLKVWIKLVENADVMVNGRRIKKTRGLAMGLSLSPVMFNFYVNKPIRLSGIEKKRVTMYMDDKAINLYDNPVKAAEQYKRIEEWMMKFGMPFNRKKCVLLSTDEQISKTFQKEFNIKTEDKEKYLGVTLKLNEDGNIESDVRYYEVGEKIFALPKFQGFLIKKTVVNSAIFAKLRFRMMMLTPTRIIEKGKIVKIMRGAFARDFPVLSFVELIYIGPNLAQLFIDLTNLNNWKEEIKDVKDITKRKEILNQKVKEIMKCGIDQLDKRVEKLELDIDIKEIEINLDGLKKVVKRTWKIYKEEVTRNWMKEKGQEEINYPKNMITWLNNKLITNCKVLLNIVFRHLDLTKGNIIAFISETIKQINDKLQREEELKNFQYRDKAFFMINKPNKKLGEEMKTKEYVYKTLDKELKEILRIAKSDKKRYKELLWTFSTMEQVIESKTWNEESMNTMIEVLNYKIMDMGEEQKIFLKIMKQEKEEEEDDELTYQESKEEENSMTIGVATMDQEIRGSIGIRKKTKLQTIEENYTFQIENEKNIQKAKLACALRAIQLAKEKKWKKVNIKGDFLGIRNYFNYEWALKDKETRLYNYWTRKIVKENKIEVNWTIIKGEGLQEIVKQNNIARKGNKDVITSIDINVFSWDGICKQGFGPNPKSIEEFVKNSIYKFNYLFINLIIYLNN